MLRSMLLFYQILVKDLEAYGFTINLYDPCVANVEIGGSQVPVVWHMYNLKVSHKDSFEITKSLHLEATYRGPSVKHGKVHDFLAMDLYFLEDGRVKVSVVEYLNNILREFPEHLGDIAKSPAFDHLFEIRAEEEECIILEEQAVTFHHTVSHLLFMSSRTRIDIYTAVSV